MLRHDSKQRQANILLKCIESKDDVNSNAHLDTQMPPQQLWWGSQTARKKMNSDEFASKAIARQIKANKNPLISPIPRRFMLTLHAQPLGRSDHSSLPFRATVGWKCSTCFPIGMWQKAGMKRRCQRILILACIQLALCLGAEAHALARLEEYAGEESHEEYIENWVIIGLFVIVIICSIAFELLIETLEEYLPRRGLHKLQDMLNCAFKELTILGFISLFLYSTVRLGYMRQLNDKYLGVSKTEEAAIVEAEEHGEEPYPPTHLTETFESIHVLIFMIMVTFIFQVAALTAVGYRTMRKLEYLDAKTDEDLKNDVASLLDHQLFNERLIRESLEHWGIRRRFTSATNPLMPKPRRPEPGRPQFSFAAYLIHCFGESLAEMIELPPSILILTLLIVVLLRPALSLPGREVIVFMILAAFSLLLLTYTAHAFLKFADAKIRPDSSGLFSLFASPAADLEALDKALHCPIDDR
ncbi:hypothetical protein Efla_000278 [Eimeria flavescens]